MTRSDQGHLSLELSDELDELLLRREAGVRLQQKQYHTFESIRVLPQIPKMERASLIICRVAPAALAFASCASGIASSTASRRATCAVVAPAAGPADALRGPAPARATQVVLELGAAAAAPRRGGPGVAMGRKVIFLQAGLLYMKVCPCKGQIVPNNWGCSIFY